jgi:hypothetical protein
LSQFSGGMQRKLLLHPHLMSLNGFDTHMQFSHQLRTLTPLPMKEKISSSRSLRLFMSELCDPFEQQLIRLPRNVR